MNCVNSLRWKILIQNSLLPLSIDSDTHKCIVPLDVEFLFCFRITRYSVLPIKTKRPLPSIRYTLVEYEVQKVHIIWRLLQFKSADLFIEYSCCWFRLLFACKHFVKSMNFLHSCTVCNHQVMWCDILQNTHVLCRKVLVKSVVYSQN